LNYKLRTEDPQNSDQQLLGTNNTYNMNNDRVNELDMTPGQMERKGWDPNNMQDGESHLNYENGNPENENSIQKSGDYKNNKLKAEGLYRRINRIYLRDLDIFYTFKDCLTSYFQYLKKTQEITQQDG